MPKQPQRSRMHRPRWPSGAATVNVRTREASEVLEQIWTATKARLKPRGLTKARLKPRGLAPCRPSLLELLEFRIFHHARHLARCRLRVHEVHARARVYGRAGAGDSTRERRFLSRSYRLGMCVRARLAGRGLPGDLRLPLAYAGGPPCREDHRHLRGAPSTCLVEPLTVPVQDYCGPASLRRVGVLVRTERESACLLGRSDVERLPAAAAG